MSAKVCYSSDHVSRRLPRDFVLCSAVKLGLSVSRHLSTVLCFTTGSYPPCAKGWQRSRRATAPSILRAARRNVPPLPSRTPNRSARSGRPAATGRNRPLVGPQQLQHDEFGELAHGIGSQALGFRLSAASSAAGDCRIQLSLPASVLSLRKRGALRSPPLRSRGQQRLLRIDHDVRTARLPEDASAEPLRANGASSGCAAPRRPARGSP